MRKVAVVALARSDLSSSLPVARAVEGDAELELAFVAADGEVAREVAAAGLSVAARVSAPMVQDTPHGFVSLAAATFAELGGWYERLRPDLVLLVGDRFELIGAAAAALPFRLAVAHISGGDVSEGAIDNAVRYAVSALSHVHFVAMEAHAARLAAVGEEPWRVHVSGDPALDYALSLNPLSRRELEARLDIALHPPVVAVTYHPTTLGTVSVAMEVDALLAALEDADATLVFSLPNRDTGREEIVARLLAFEAVHPHARVAVEMGQQAYYSLMRHADAMVGNSSSGIWEAPSFELPVVNVGERQAGRIRVGNVIDVQPEARAIASALRQCLDAGFRESLRGITNPYGDGAAADRVVHVLKEVDLGPALLRKRFGAPAVVHV